MSADLVQRLQSRELYRPKPEWDDTHFDRARPGDILFHGMLFPGIYPGYDQQEYDLYKQIRKHDTSTPFHDRMRALVGMGVIVQRLCILPNKGMYGLTSEDITYLRRRNANVQRQTGIDVRQIQYGEMETALFNTFPAKRDSPSNNTLVNFYESGLYGGSGPKGSFWGAAYGPPAGEQIPHFNAVGIMAYDADQFRGILPFEVPMPKEVAAYSRFFQEQFHALPAA